MVTIIKIIATTAVVILIFRFFLDTQSTADTNAITSAAAGNIYRQTDSDNEKTTNALTRIQSINASGRLSNMFIGITSDM